MIQAKEVRIGNLVEFNGEVFEIESISRDLPNIKLDSRGIGVVPWVSLNGVTLTEEWLVKFGFEFNVDYVIFKNGFTICFEKQGSWLNCFLESIGIEILYVHQLQNLYFALTAQELTLTPNETHNN